jgi:PAS domain S-box-containing protein
MNWITKALRISNAASLQRTNRELEREVGERTRAEERLRLANTTLEIRVAERVAELRTLNEKLLRDKARFEIATDAAGLGFWTLDVEPDSLRWDKGMFALYSLAPSTEPQPFSRWIGCLHPGDRERCAREVRETLSGGHAYETEFRTVRSNFETRYLRSAGRISRDAEGRVTHMFGVTFDTTESRRADERFRLAIDAAPTGMLLMSLTGTIVMVNAEIEHLFGYTRAELIGKQVEVLVPERFRQRHPEFRKGFFDAPRARAMGAGRDLFGLRKDGSEMPVEIGLNPLRTSEGEFVLSSIVDLTHRQEVDRLRADFVSTVSHELRTPLTSISGSLGLLQSGALGALPAKAAAMVDIASKNSQRLVRIINDILDIGKLEADQLTLRVVSVPLMELLQQAIEANANYAEKCEVRLRFDGVSTDDWVSVDPDRLVQVLANLLSNAAKFSRPGSEVLVRMIPHSAHVRVEVEDSGPGISLEFQSRIFEKFAQAESSATRRFAGTGLGLSIARKLIDAMGGTIGYTTSIGQGTTFYLELPRNADAANATRMIRISESAAHKVLRARPLALPSQANLLPKLLYVEDDEDLITVIGATLAGRVDIVAAHGLRDAEQLLRGQQFDLVILDQMLPDGDGLVLVDRIPEFIGRKVPIILLVTDSPKHLHGRVDAVLIKSQTTATQVAASILSHLPAD